MENKNKNAISVALCLSLVAVLVFNVYSTAIQYANAVQWTIIFNSATNFAPNWSLIDSNGNIDVTTSSANANVLQFSGRSPYTLIHSVTLGNGCNAMNNGMFVDTVGGGLWASCSGAGVNNVAKLDITTLGVLNTTQPSTSPTEMIWTIGNIMYAQSFNNNIFSYFVSGSNMIKCGTNAGQCSVPWDTIAPTGCVQVYDVSLDFVHNVGYQNCNNPVGIYKFSLSTLTSITSWTKSSGCTGVCLSQQNGIAYDSVNNAIWSGENSANMVEYNSTGGILKTINLSGAGILKNPQIVGKQVFFLDLTRALLWSYFTGNGTQVGSVNFGNTINTPVTGTASLVVSTNNIAIIGAQPNAGGSMIILGGFAQGNLPTSGGGGNGGGGGGGGGNGCPSTTTNCGDVNCNLPQNTGLLLCTTGGGAVQNGGFFVSTAVNNLLMGSGLINSTNTNIKTNGTGYILVMVALGVLIAMFWLASGGDLGRIPTFVWFIATLGVLGLAVGVGFIDVTFFIIGAIAVIALATARILSTLELGGFR